MVADEWRDNAICRNADPNLYDLDWVEQTWGITDWWRQDEYATQLCAGCPVIAECARAALNPVDVADYACTPEPGASWCWTEGVVQAGLALRPVRQSSRHRVTERLARVAGVGMLRRRVRAARACCICGLGFSDVVSGGVSRSSQRLCVGCVEMRSVSVS